MLTRALQTNDEKYLQSMEAYVKDKELIQWLRKGAEEEYKKYKSTR